MDRTIHPSHMLDMAHPRHNLITKVLRKKAKETIKIKKAQITQYKIYVVFTVLRYIHISHQIHHLQES